jgi:hypothetical protein
LEEREKQHDENRSDLPQRQQCRRALQPQLRAPCKRSVRWCYAPRRPRRGGLAVGRRLGRREVTSWHAFWHRCRRWSAMFFRRRPPQERPNDGCARADHTTCRCCSNPPARNTPTPTRSRLGRESGEASAVTKPLPAKLGRAGQHEIGEVKPAA